MLTIPKNVNFLLFVNPFNNLSPKTPNCQNSLSQNWQLVRYHCPVETKANTQSIRGHTALVINDHNAVFRKIFLDAPKYAVTYWPLRKLFNIY